MFKYLRIAILPLVAATVMPIPQGMAEGMPMQSYNSTRPHIILVDKYDDIKGCQRACDEDFEECVNTSKSVYQSGSAQWHEGIQACSVLHQNCRQNCYR